MDFQGSLLRRGRQVGKSATRKVGRVVANGGFASVLDDASKTEKVTINTRTELSKQYQVSERKAKHARLLRKADPAAAQAVKEGTALLADAVRAVKKRQMIEQLESIQAMQAKEVEGTFDVIVADPAWDTNK